MDFDYQNKIVFPAGKEYRYMDIRNLRNPPSHVLDVSTDIYGINVTLKGDRLRSNIAYFESNDINGAFIISADDKFNPILSGEYADVLFSYQRSFENPDSDYYVFGELTSFNFQEEARMDYYEDLKGYATKMRLKQGYYNYYIVVTNI